MTAEHAPLILDVAGTRLTDDDRRRLAHPLTGGAILFARNWDNRAQLLELTASMKAVREDLLICVDHEGGRVQRFRTDGFTHLPPMRALGELWMDDGKGAKAVPGSGALRATNANSSHADIDLSSRRVRLARWILEGVRNGRSLGELLGVRFERAVKGTPAEAHLAALRTRFAPATGFGVLDGLRLQQEGPGTITEPAVRTRRPFFSRWRDPAGRTPRVASPSRQ